MCASRLTSPPPKLIVRRTCCAAKNLLRVKPQGGLSSVKTPLDTYADFLPGEVRGFADARPGELEALTYGFEEHPESEGIGVVSQNWIVAVAGDGVAFLPFLGRPPTVNRPPRRGLLVGT